jgi:hypothetical protein
MSQAQQTRRVDRSGHTIRPGRPTVRTTFQLSARLARGLWDEALKICVDWLGRKFPEPMPGSAYVGESLELDVHGQTLGCIAISQMQLWSARVQMPDAPFDDSPAVAGRSWTTEIGLRREGDGVRFAVRNVCASLPNCDAPIAYTTPVIVTDLADQLGLIEVRRLDGAPWELKQDGELDQLREFLEDPARSLPVYVLAEKCAIDAAALARRTLGLAHVVLLPHELANGWAQRVGGEWAADSGAVRTYHAGLRFSDDSPLAHAPVAAEKIASFRFEDLEGPAACAAALIEQAYAACVGKKMDWAGCLFYADARTKQAELQRAAAGDEKEWREAYEAEITALKSKLDESLKEIEAFNDDAIHAARERDMHREEAARLRILSDSLRAALSAKTGQAADAAIAIPGTYDELPRWVEQHLVGRLLLHPRAKRGLRDADYEEVQLVYRALLLLANEFRATQRGEPRAREQLDARIAELGLHLSRSIAPARAAQQGDEYFLKYPLGSDKTSFLELHLRKGNSKKTQYCLAIYFFWDDQTEQVVVGWLPSHLDNRMT